MGIRLQVSLLKTSEQHKFPVPCNLHLKAVLKAEIPQQLKLEIVPDIGTKTNTEIAVIQPKRLARFSSPPTKQM